MTERECVVCKKMKTNFVYSVPTKSTTNVCAECGQKRLGK